MSQSPLESRVFTPEREPVAMFSDLIEHLNRQARLEAGPSWPRGMTASFDLQRRKREVLIDADPRGDTPKDELTKYTFSGAADPEGRTRYNLSMSISTTSMVKEVPVFHVRPIYACLVATCSNLIEYAVIDTKNKFEPVDDPLDISSCSLGFMRAMSAYVLQAKQYSLRDWTKYEYGMDEAAFEFWYRERQGYKINDSKLVIAEYSSDEDLILDEYVHGVGLDENDEETVERFPYEVDEGVDLETTQVPIDEQGILFEDEFRNLIENQFQADELLTTPFYEHARRVVKLVDEFQNPKVFDEEK